MISRWLRLGRRKLWTLPAVTGPAGRPVPARLKEVSAARLRELMAKNIASGRGANGRPAWLAENIASIRRVVLFAQNYEAPGLLRCNAVLFGSGDFDWMFTVDLLLTDFDQLQDLSQMETSALLREYLLQVPVLPLDDDQEARWRRMMTEPYPRDE